MQSYLYNSRAYQYYSACSHLRTSFFISAFLSCRKQLVISDHDYKTLGTSAHDLLASAKYTSLQVQVSYMPGFSPDPASIDSLYLFLNRYLNKPGGIEITGQQIPASGKPSLTLNEIVQAEKQYRTVFTAGNTVTVHILITDGTFSGDDIFAKSYWNTSTCILGKAIAGNSGGAGQISRTQLLTTLIEHEFGHLLGLVGQGTPMITDHRDPANGAHCNNPGCLMYYIIQTNSAYAASIPLFDANCLADVKANGGK